MNFIYNKKICDGLLLIAMFHCCAVMPNEKMITNMQQADGFGSQFQTIIATAVYAELHDMRFIYTPFKVMEHNYEQEKNFLEKKENLINIRDHFEVRNSFNSYRFVTGINVKAFFDRHVEECVQTKAFKEIKANFRINKKDTHSDAFRIAVHVRRPNAHDTRLMGSDVPDETYLRTIEMFRKLYANYHPVFHIYSQGDANTLRPYSADDTIFHLNDSIEDTFTGMVFADVLVVAPSSLSYVAGWLCEGFVYYIPFWHSPLPGWVSIEKLADM